MALLIPRLENLVRLPILWGWDWSHHGLTLVNSSEGKRIYKGLHREILQPFSYALQVCLCLYCFKHAGTTFSTSCKFTWDLL